VIRSAGTRLRLCGAHYRLAKRNFSSLPFLASSVEKGIRIADYYDGIAGLHRTDLRNSLGTEIGQNA
jgi:hypothetical protein